MAVGKLDQAAHFSRRQDRPIICIRRRYGDVVTQSTVKQHGVLLNITHIAPQIRRVELPKIDTVHADRALSGRVKSQHQPLQSSLARTDTTNDNDVFARFNPE